MNLSSGWPNCGTNSGEWNHTIHREGWRRWQDVCDDQTGTNKIASCLYVIVSLHSIDQKIQKFKCNMAIWSCWQAWWFPGMTRGFLDEWHVIFLWGLQKSQVINREVQLRFGQLRHVPLVVKPALLHVCIGVGTNTADLFVMSQSSSSKHQSPCFPGHAGTPPIDTIEVIDTFAFEFSSHPDARRGMGDVRKIWHDTSCLSANMWHTFTDKMTWAPETICEMNVVVVDYDYYMIILCFFLYFVVFQADSRMPWVNWIVDLDWFSSPRSHRLCSKPKCAVWLQATSSTCKRGGSWRNRWWRSWLVFHVRKLLIIPPYSRIALKHSEKMAADMNLGRCKQQSTKSLGEILFYVFLWQVFMERHV